MSGKKVARKPKRMLRDNIRGLTKPAITRVARQGGVTRLDGLTYDEIRGITAVRLDALLRSTLTFTQNGRRKIVSTTDVVNGIEAAFGERISVDPKGEPVPRCKQPSKRKKAADAE